MNDMREQALRLQRLRIHQAMTATVSKEGYAGASIRSVCARARISRHVFYKLYDSLEDCFLAVLDEGAEHVSTLIAQALAREPSEIDGVRGALLALLEYFDVEPQVARVLVIEAPAAGPRARERREQHLASLKSLVEDGLKLPAAGQAHPTLAAGIIASLLGTLHTHLVTAHDRPLTTLLGPMMGLASAPYLDRREVTHQIEHAENLARELLARHDSENHTIDHAASHHATGSCHTLAGTAEIPAMLLDSRAHRARACLLHVAAHPGASNRQIARAIGMTGDNHISALLSRLHDAGLLKKHTAPPGHANAWTPTTQGEQVAKTLQPPTPSERPENLMCNLDAAHTWP